MRVENLFFLDKKKSGLSSLEYLGLAMAEAGNEFGPDTAYGKEFYRFLRLAHFVNEQLFFLLQAAHS